MRVNVRFFAMLRDAAEGRDATVLDLPTRATVADALSQLVASYPRLDGLLAKSATAVNRAYASRETLLNDGDELALIPPVSGG